MNIIFIAQQVVDFDTGQANPQCVDRQLGGVKVVDTVAVAQLARESIVAADGVDLVACILCQLADARKGFLAAQGQIAARDIQAGQEQVGAARCLS